MKPMFKTVALIGKYNSQETGETLATLQTFFAEQGVKVLIEKQTAGLVGYRGDNIASTHEIGENADLAVVLGGDGTMLHIARSLASSDVPLIGINGGHLGFLTDLSLDNMLEKLEKILAGEFYLEERILLKATVIRQGEKVFKALAFNDVVIDKGAISRLIDFNIFINQQFAYNQRSDGLILSTPTGSTAYALSAGGPIVHPSLSAIILAPICPHTLTNRPLVVHSNSLVEIEMLHCADGRVHIDGHCHYDLIPHDRIRIEKFRNGIILLHPHDHDYYDTLRLKLNWGINSIHY